MNDFAQHFAKGDFLLGTVEDFDKARAMPIKQVMSFAAPNNAPYRARLMPQMCFICKRTRVLFTIANQARTS